MIDATSGIPKPTRTAPPQNTTAQTPSVNALKASLADSLPLRSAMAIMKRQKVSAAMTGHSALCSACMSGSDSFAPKQAAARIFAAAIPADDGAAFSSSLPFVCARLGKSSLQGLPGNPLGFTALSQRLALPLVWQAFRTAPYPRRFVSVIMGFDAEAKAGDICVQLAPHGADIVALPIQKATGRSCVFRDMRDFIPNAGGQALPAGARVQAELFFNSLLF